jgi:hypothetical protein
MRTILVIGMVAGAALAPRLALAGGEAEEVRQMFQECINSGGRAASSYNAWVAQNGCICPGQSTGSGQRTCSSGAASSAGGGDLKQESAKAIGEGLMHGNAGLVGMGVAGTLINNALTGNANNAPRDNPAARANFQNDAARNHQQADAAFNAEAERQKAAAANVQSTLSQGFGGLQSRDLSGDASAQAPAKEQGAAAPLTGRSDAFKLGFGDASQCYSQNAGPRCAGVPAAQQQTCLADYRAGYQVGDRQRQQALNEAYRAGQLAGAKGELANAQADPRASGPCGTEWTEAYNRGHFEAKQAGRRP